MKKSWRFTILLALLLAGGIVVNGWHYLGEKRVTRKELKDFPKQVDNWQQSGTDHQFDDATLAVLQASDYTMRDYRAPNGQLANFYVGYYVTQAEGATYHSPLNCMPGSGWVMSQPGLITISPKGRPAFQANSYMVENSGNKQLLVYWYQGRGRTVASEYWGKLYTVLDSVRMRRSDGAMVRVTIPVGNSETAAMTSAAELAASVSTVLPEFIPD
jgi:EpsI family protein